MQSFFLTVLFELHGLLTMALGILPNLGLWDALAMLGSSSRSDFNTSRKSVKDGSRSGRLHSDLSLPVLRNATESLQAGSTIDRGPEELINKRISDSGSKAQYRLDTRNYGLEDPYV